MDKRTTEVKVICGFLLVFEQLRLLYIYQKFTPTLWSYLNLALVRWHLEPLHVFSPYLLCSQTSFVVNSWVSLRNNVWWCFVHFLHIGGVWRFSAMCPFLKQFMQNPSSQTTLILCTSMHPLNTLQVCIWWRRFLHARHVSSVDDAKDCLAVNFWSDPEACLCAVWVTVSKCLEWMSKKLMN